MVPFPEKVRPVMKILIFSQKGVGEPSAEYPGKDGNPVWESLLVKQTRDRILKKPGLISLG